MTTRSNAAVMMKQLGKSLAEIAELMKVSQSCVAMWQTGQRMPKEPARENIQRHFGIPVEAWDEDAEEPEIAPPVPVHVAPRRSTISTDGAPTNARASVAERASRLDAMVNEMMRQLDDPETRLPLREQAKLHESIGRTLERLQKIRGESVSEVKLVRHPKWIELKNLILGALENHPDATLDVLRAIDRAHRAEFGEDDERDKDDESHLASSPA